ncbi:MAG: hypothetical protein HUK15_05220 [Bacteroidales bacterium]|nr:hypothetical protein [Bacteroidales bacterium]
MGTVRIQESGMTFLVDSEALYHIEKTIFYTNLPDGIKRPEFLMLQCDGVLAFVEAKTSLPNPKINGIRFNDSCSEICDKFNNALLLFNSTHLKRKGDDAYNELKYKFKKIGLSNATYRFYLVIKNSQKDWLPPVSDKLKQKMQNLLICWGIEDTAIKVLNEEMARNKGLIE